MKSMTLCMIALAVPGALLAQDITGTWQGTLQGPRELRAVMKIVKGDGNAPMRVTFYSIDQGGQGLPGTATVQGTAVKVSLPGIGGTFEGKLDGSTIAGTWSQGPMPIALTLTKATTETAWVIPEPPKPPTPMDPNANPTFDVATVKPSDPDRPGKAFLVRGREFSTLNTTLAELLTFAYGVHPRQISGAPAWVESDKFDITARPDGEGQPNEKQWKSMLQKLLADRFKLSFHRDKKELSVYIITVAKGGPKLTKSEGDPNGLPGMFFRGRGSLPARNANMSDLAGLMQSTVLDRPVLDQSGVTGRFDFTLNWTPDEFQFAGAPAGPPPPNDGTSRPDLFTAFQEQLGLKLEAGKAPAEVLVIDRAEKPSAN